MTVSEWREQIATYRREAHTPLDSAVWAMRFASMLDKACDEIDERAAWPSKYLWVRTDTDEPPRFAWFPNCPTHRRDA